MFQRFFDDGLAQSSYLVACERTREAVIVDPRRDIDVYVDYARERGLSIVYAIDTHIHADFLSGSRELAALGARPVEGPGAGVRFPHHEATNRETLTIGDAQLHLLHTPGHTPEHVSVLVEQPGEPRRVLTGDTLFVGAVGRPDLLGDELARRLAGELFDSLTHTLLALDDEIEVHPGHGAGSLCGAGIGSEPFTTIGRERRFNALLQHRDRESFVAAVLADLPETPPYFPRMKRENHEGPPVLRLGKTVVPPRAMSAAEAGAAMAAGALMLDLRPPDVFAQSHPDGALHLEFGPRVGYWAAWVVPAVARLVLLAEGEGQAEQVRRQLLRVGLDNVEGWVQGAFAAWRDAGQPVSSVGRMTMADLATRMGGDGAGGLTLVDVRSRQEFETGHVDGALHIPLGEIAARAAELPVGPVATLCEAGYRSSLAASLLARQGIDRVSSVAGGMGEYRRRQAV